MVLQLLHIISCEHINIRSDLEQFIRNSLLFNLGACHHFSKINLFSAVLDNICNAVRQNKTINAPKHTA
jgi:hypothetical protein